ncbi:MAG TPA: hypothetical protein DEP48_07110 [Persephonella sp.]|uniref:hypothetical protein n=1 Tax=Persephonella TaxID=182899 RepID=UPI0005A03704|nr:MULTISPECIES: hypothetical protein [Persephonella]HCB70112.1 hypothetical protein [Persephonella sp.]
MKKSGFIIMTFIALFLFSCTPKGVNTTLQKTNYKKTPLLRISSKKAQILEAIELNLKQGKFDEAVKQCEDIVYGDYENMGVKCIASTYYSLAYLLQGDIETFLSVGNYMEEFCSGFKTIPKQTEVLINLYNNWNRKS